MLQQVQWSGEAFAWRASPGSSYDMWPWVYPAQTSQYYSFPASWVGNQLPNWSKIIPVLATDAQVNRPWSTHSNPQQQNTFQTGASGQTTMAWSQQGVANYLTRLGGMFTNANAGGGRLSREKKRMPITNAVNEMQSSYSMGGYR